MSKQFPQVVDSYGLVPNYALLAAVEAVEVDYEVIMLWGVLELNNPSSFGNYYQSAYYNVRLS